jgi:hypothetical protein
MRIVERSTSLASSLRSLQLSFLASTNNMASKPFRCLALMIGLYSASLFLFSVLLLDPPGQANKGPEGAASRPLQSNLKSKLKPQFPFLLSRDDYIMQRDYDKSPIVVPEFKLLFFSVPKVGCTVWKQLFRRIAGWEDWKDPELAHDPQLNGLLYLSNFTDQQANRMMLSPDWQKALFVRDPKERFLSAYLDKAVSNFGSHLIPCCRRAHHHQHLQMLPSLLASVEEQLVEDNSTIMSDDADASSNRTQACIVQAQTNLSQFFSLIHQSCPEDAHWLPQSQRLDQKYWKYLSPHDNNHNNRNKNKLFVGNMDTKERDARILLETIGAWKDYGASGWGALGNASIFSSRSNQLTHLTHAKHQLPWYYDPPLEQLIDDYYRQDYELSILNLTNLPIAYE